MEESVHDTGLLGGGFWQQWTPATLWMEKK
jgi:hypothetical protein